MVFYLQPTCSCGAETDILATEGLYQTITSVVSSFLKPTSHAHLDLCII